MNTGRVLGGRSTVSSMVYLRGSSKNYNLWERLGAAGWGFRDVVPYFHKLENFRIEEFQTSGKLQCLIFFYLYLVKQLLCRFPGSIFFLNKWISLIRNDWHNYFTLILNCFLVLSVWYLVYTRLVGQEWNISENQYFIILCFHWPAYHSTKGPVMVSDGSQTHPLLHDIYQKASATLGLKSTDCNGKDYVGKWWRSSSRFVVY